MKSYLRWLVFCAILIAVVLGANFVLEGHIYGGSLDSVLPMAAMAICAPFALLLSDLASRHRLPTWSRSEWAILVIIIALYCLVYARSKIFDFDPNTQIEGLTEAAAKVAVIPQSVSVPNRKAMFGFSAMYGLLLTRFDVVLIYGVNGKESQDAILQQFVQYHRAHRTRPLRVEFFERENWTTFKSPGRTGGSRGPEIVIRQDVIR